RQDKLFARAGGKEGVLDVTTKEGARYKSYDADQDGKVSKAEFKEGYKADLREVWQARRESGKLTDQGLRERLAFGRDSFANQIEMPTSAGDLHASRNDWFISQYGTKFNPNEDVPGWDNANCGPTSLTMVARAFGKIDISAEGADAAIEKSRKLMGDSQSETSGTSGEGIARGAEAYGLDAKIVNNIDLKGIEAELAKGRLPVVNGNVIRPDGSYGGGHFYVVTKIEGGKAYLNDPYSKTGPTVVSTDRLMHSINSHWSHRIISIGEK
ncbi:MAG: C39 family peptidase, partial [Candidatus Sericytochromatia bacterium]